VRPDRCNCIDPMEVANMAKERRHEPIGEPMRKAAGVEVAERLRGLKGSSRADLERDAERGARSPLGGGSHAKPVKRKER
jgi:hypothetical protein